MTGETIEQKIMRLEGVELDAFLREIGMDPDELLAQFNRVMLPHPVRPAERTQDSDK